MNKILNTVLSVLLTLLLIFTIVYAQTGTYTTHGLFYLPKYGASGVTEYNKYNDYMEIADQQIWANKEAIEAIEIPDLDGYVLINDIDSETELETLLTDVTDVYTNNDFDIADYLLIANKYTDAEAVTAIKADADWNATDWDTALQDITAESIGDLSDVDTTGVTDNKILKYDLATTTWVIADDDNTTYTSSDFTHDDLTGVTANEHIDWTTSQAPTVIHADNYTDTDTTYTAGTGLSLLGTEFSSTITQYADADAIAAIKGDAAWKATDWDTAYGWGNHSTQGYLKNITNENFASLKDIPAHPAANNKILETVADGTYKYIDTPSGGAGATTYLDLTDTPAAYDNGKYAKSTAAGVVWDTPTGSGDMLKSTYDADADGDIDVAAGGTEKSSWTQYCIPYLSGTTAFGEIAIGTAAQLLKVNATANGYEWFTPSYLTDITSESILDLSDTPVAFSSGKFLKSGAAAVTFASITESDISDLGSYLENVVEDTTPQLGGNLDATDKNITGIGRASFTQEYDNGSKSANFTIDFATDQKQKVTLTANTMTLTLDTTSVGVANYLLKIVNGGLATLTWAAETGSVYWPGGTEPTLTSSGTDIVALYFDGTNWYCQASLDFK